MNPCTLFYKLLLDLQPFLEDVLFHNLAGYYRNKRFNPSRTTFKPSIAIPVSVTDIREVRAVQLLNNIFKKLVCSGSTAADRAGLAKFLHVNKKCDEWVDPQGIGGPAKTIQDHFVVLIMNSMKYELHKVLSMTGVFDWVNLFKGADLGPGKVCNISDYDFFSKLFSEGVSASSKSLVLLYRTITSLSPTWKSAEDRRYDLFGEVVISNTNKLFYVPKDCEASRTACTEPVINTFFQQCIKTVLETCLNRYYGIDIRFQQEINRALARSGSLYRGKPLVTIDLVSSSDLLSVRLILSLFPICCTYWMEIARSSFCTYVSGPNANGDSVTKTIELNMMATMGNAFCFPMQTLFYTVLVKAIYLYLDIPFIKSATVIDRNTGNRVVSKLGNFGVFGDDIIVVDQAKDLLLICLEAFGCKLNEQKSCLDGYFRESCGGDFYLGQNVRPFFIKDLDTTAGLFVAFNSCMEWSSSNRIPLPNFASALIECIKPEDRLYVPRFESDDAGLKFPLEYLPVRYQRHYDLYGFYTYECNVQASAGFRIEHQLRSKDSYIDCFDSDEGRSWFVRKHRSHELDPDAFSLYVLGNPQGFLLACLRGDITGGWYGCRENVDPCYTLKTRTTFSWLGSYNPFSEANRSLSLWTADQALTNSGRCSEETYKNSFRLLRIDSQ